MIRLLGSIPEGKLWVGTSGGVDSMVALDFLRRKHQVAAIFVHHNTKYSDQAHRVVTKYCDDHGIPLIFSIISKEKPKEMSQEEFWREERYRAFESYDLDGGHIVTAHHLDDAVETYIWRCMHGRSDTIRYRRGQVIRPFLLNRKQEFYSWAKRKSVPFLEDPSNQDTKYTRNLIRHELMPLVLKINPGLYKTIQKKVEQQFMLDTLTK
ncbi:MAG: tRNA lysidine(34) synthetase TilS [Fischerella sp.]|nr:tRNA lysidine(34) synthetase TilS [Fischerella sp.]